MANIGKISESSKFLPNYFYFKTKKCVSASGKRIIYILNSLSELEVVVETEGQVVAIEVETEGVCSLSSIYVKLVILVTEETEVSNKAELVVEVNSNTGLYTYTERIALQTISISMSIVNSTVNEYVNLVELLTFTPLILVWFSP